MSCSNTKYLLERNHVPYNPKRITPVHGWINYTEASDELDFISIKKFKFANPWFYRLFRHRNYKAEDYIGQALNSARRFDQQRQKRFEKVLDRKLHRLYRTITRKYFG